MDEGDYIFIRVRSFQVSVYSGEKRTFSPEKPSGLPILILVVFIFIVPGIRQSSQSTGVPIGEVDERKARVGRAAIGGDIRDRHVPAGGEPAGRGQFARNCVPVDAPVSGIVRDYDFLPAGAGIDCNSGRVSVGGRR